MVFGLGAFLLWDHNTFPSSNQSDSGMSFSLMSINSSAGVVIVDCTASATVCIHLASRLAFFSVSQIGLQKSLRSFTVREDQSSVVDCCRSLSVYVGLSVFMSDLIIFRQWFPVVLSRGLQRFRFTLAGLLYLAGFY